MLDCIGLDVSKSSINVHIRKTNQDLQTNNTLQNLKSLHSKLKKIYKKDIEDIVFIFEPTESYSELLRKFCADKLIGCFIINPNFIYPQILTVSLFYSNTFCQISRHIHIIPKSNRNFKC